ncbi:hypothetical protein [Bradyrhizobium sp. WYCCWR 12699]|uniref:hypothetical protein n=1 Tax=Bradyrhizobium sp. WYCCWR 12699 TaxID=3064203 RepID=UPI0028A446B3|nr:hypothetical protein [Bradyrhizobium sp. WYCCWR 12699]MDT4737230.1 hypothetical protein [Bradyrhizobium sp. WYCCWR 12699]
MSTAFAQTVWLIAALNVVFACELAVLSFRKEWFLLGWQNRPRAGNVARYHSNGPLGHLAILVAFSVLLPFASSAPFAMKVLSGALFMVTAALFHLQRYGHEGSDHVRLYANVILFGAALVGSDETTISKAVLLAALAALGASFYFGAGWVKVLSPKWRSGEAITIAFSTRLFGNEQFAAALAKHKVAALAISWAVIVWELSFGPAMLLVGHYIFLWICVGLLFHGAVAVLMRLPVFLVASLTLYPSMYWVATEAVPAWFCLMRWGGA